MKLSYNNLDITEITETISYKPSRVPCIRKGLRATGTAILWPSGKYLHVRWKYNNLEKRKFIILNYSHNYHEEGIPEEMLNELKDACRKKINHTCALSILKGTS